MLNQISLELGQSKPLIIDNLVDLVLYVQSQNGNRFNGSKYLSKFGFEDPRLISIHQNNSCLYIDKYFETCIPDIQTEFLLESVGKSPEDYEAFLGKDIRKPTSDFKPFIKPDPSDSKKEFCRFWVNYCDNKGDISKLITPIIHGGSWNPYVRFNSSKISGSKQLNKIRDLVGLQSINVYEDPVIFDLLVLTFPEVVSLQLLHSNKRNLTIKKMWLCHHKFFHELRFLFGLDPAQSHGCNSSLHLWSSSFPFLPHAHFHMVFPHFCYLNISKDYREDVEEVCKDLYDKLYDCSDYTKRRSLQCELSNKLEDLLYFEQLKRIGPVHNKRVLPFDVDLLKFIWSEIVEEVFQLQDLELDIHCEFVKSSNKAKLLHYLQYKNRPPILDLDLFFRKCQNFITGYDSLDPAAAIGYIQGLFVSAVMKENVEDSKRYESLLLKTEDIFKRFDSKKILSWLRFLSVWQTDTRVLGFWQNIKRYRVTHSTRGELPSSFVCPVCGGNLFKFGGVNSPLVGFMIINIQSKFKVFDLGDPGG